MLTYVTPPITRSITKITLKDVRWIRLPRSCSASPHKLDDIPNESQATEKIDPDIVVENKYVKTVHLT